MDVEEERLALLLAVVADVDPGGELLADHVGQGGLAQRVELGGVYCFAAAALHVELGQRRGARQAAGVGGQDPSVAFQHGVSPQVRLGQPAATHPASDAHCLLEDPV